MPSSQKEEGLPAQEAPVSPAPADSAPGIVAGLSQPPLDISVLTDAWLARDIAVLTPWCEVVGDRAGTQLYLDTDVWTMIMNELVRRQRAERDAILDMRSRNEGFRDFDHALRSLAESLDTEVYLRISAP